MQCTWANKGPLPVHSRDLGSNPEPPWPTRSMQALKVEKPPGTGSGPLESRTEAEDD